MTALILVMLVLVSMKQTQLSPSKCYCGVFSGISWICVQRSAAVLSVFPFSLKYEFEDVTGIVNTSFKAIFGLLFTCGNIHHAVHAKGHICLAVVIDVILFWSTRLSPDTMQCCSTMVKGRHLFMTWGAPMEHLSTSVRQVC
jgi:hypothetical protein